VESLFLSTVLASSGKLDVFAGSRDDVIRRTPRGLGWGIVRRTIYLDQATLQSNNLNIFF
jgi:hypothetical protein